MNLQRPNRGRMMQATPYHDCRVTDRRNDGLYSVNSVETASYGVVIDTNRGVLRSEVRQSIRCRADCIESKSLEIGSASRFHSNSLSAQLDFISHTLV